MATTPTMLSLGHSCQTRFILDGLESVSRRMPFDFNITTRPALIAALDSDGASLRHDEGSARIFAMPSDGREGIEVDGLFYWHDYPLGPDGLRLAAGWQREIGRVNEKFAALWSRLSDMLRSDEAKTLVLSNSQHNLSQFSATDAAFAQDFGLGRTAFEEITQALERFGARNYRLLMLTRFTADLAETALLADQRLDHRLVGILSLRPDGRVATSIAPGSPLTPVTQLAGPYESGLWHITPLSAHNAIISRQDEAGLTPFGSITAAGTAHVAWFEGRDRFQDIDIGSGEIRFADGSRWRRD